MLVYVKYLTGKIIPIEVKPEDSVDSVCFKIQEIEGIPSDFIRLICEGKSLERSQYIQSQQPESCQDILKTNCFGLFAINKDHFLSKIPLNSIDHVITITGNTARVQTVYNFFNPFEGIEKEEIIESHFMCPIPPHSAIVDIIALSDECQVTGKLELKENAEENQNNAILNDERIGAFSELDYKQSDILKMKLGKIPSQQQIKIITTYVQPVELFLGSMWRFTIPICVSQKCISNQNPISYFENYPVYNKNGIQWNVRGRLVSEGKISFFDSNSHQIQSNSQDGNSIQFSFHDKEEYNQLNQNFQLLFCYENDLVIKNYSVRLTKTSLYQYVASINFYPNWFVKEKDFKILLEQREKSIEFIQSQQEGKVDFLDCQNEFIFFIERSRSMDGDLLKMEVQSLIYFLKSIPSNSYFNIVSFGSIVKFYSQQSLKANQLNIDNAVKEVKKFKADLGKTQLFSAICQIYNKQPIPGYDAQIIILTNGAVSYPESIYKIIEQNRWKFRVSTIGIGNDVSIEFVQKSAKLGNGEWAVVQNEKTLSDQGIDLLFKCSNQRSVGKFDIKSSADALWIVPDPSKVERLKWNENITFYFLFDSKEVQSRPQIDFELKCWDQSLGSEVSFPISIDTKNYVKSDDEAQIAIKQSYQNFKLQGNDANIRLVKWSKNPNLQESLLNLTLKYQVLTSATDFTFVMTEQKVEDKIKPKQSNLIPINNSIDYSNVFIKGEIEQYNSAPKLEGRTLSHYNIQPQSTIHMLVQVIGLSNFAPPPRSAKRQNISIKEERKSDQYEENKEKIIEWEGLKQEEVLLSLAEIFMEEGLWRFNLDFLGNVLKIEIEIFTQNQPVQFTDDQWFTAIVVRWIKVQNSEFQGRLLIIQQQTDRKLKGKLTFDVLKLVDSLIIK